MKQYIKKSLPERILQTDLSSGLQICAEGIEKNAEDYDDYHRYGQRQHRGPGYSCVDKALADIYEGDGTACKKHMTGHHAHQRPYMRPDSIAEPPEIFHNRKKLYHYR